MALTNSIALRFWSRRLMAILSWIPVIVFFSIMAYMFVTDFQNPVDEYFVGLILKACLILIIAATLGQVAALSLILVWTLTRGRRRLNYFNSSFEFLNAFPLIDIGIFSIAIFFTAPTFTGWIVLLALFMLVPAATYWLCFLEGPARNLYVFARFHRVARPKIHSVLANFYIKSFIEYFFTVLKRALMPFVFVLVVMDFRIILPRLIEAGLSYQAFALFLSLIISLHLQSYKKAIA